MITGGQADLRGQDLLTADAKALRQVHGPQIGMMYQDSLRALNPVMKIGKQITEVLQAHDAPGVDEETARDLLHSVGLSDPARLMSQYPHELSGGMRQRVMTAMSLALSPRILFADEPTTALDVTIQAQILDLLRHRAIEMGTAIVIVSHDLGVIANLWSARVGHVRRPDCRTRYDRRGVFRSAASVYGGIAQLCATYRPWTSPTPPSSRDARLIRPTRLLAVASRLAVWLRSMSANGAFHRCFQSVTTVSRSCLRSEAVDEVGVELISAAQRQAAEHDVDHREPGALEPILVVRELTRHFRIGRGRRAPILRAGPTASISTSAAASSLGSSASRVAARSTLGRMLVGLEPADAGTVTLEGTEITAATGRAARSMRRFSQMVFPGPSELAQPAYDCGATPRRGARALPDAAW